MPCPWPIGNCPHPTACECDRIYNQGDPMPSLHIHGQRAIDEWHARQEKQARYMADLKAKMEAAE